MRLLQKYLSRQPIREQDSSHHVVCCRCGLVLLAIRGQQSSCTTGTAQLWEFQTHLAACRLQWLGPEDTPVLPRHWRSSTHTRPLWQTQTCQTRHNHNCHHLHCQPVWTRVTHLLLSHPQSCDSVVTLRYLSVFQVSAPPVASPPPVSPHHPLQALPTPVAPPPWTPHPLPPHLLPAPLLRSPSPLPLPFLHCLYWGRSVTPG